METSTSVAWSPDERRGVSRRLCGVVRGRSRRVLGAMVSAEAVSVTSPTGFTDAELKALIAAKEACLRAVDPHHPLLFRRS